MFNQIYIVLISLIILCNTQQQQQQQQQQQHQQQQQQQPTFKQFTVLQIPPNACPNYFQYLQYGGHYIGKLTLPSTVNDIELVVFFSQRQPLQTNYYGNISLFEDRQTTVKRLQQHQAISYRIEFPTNTEVPKLTRITVNGQDICVSNEYPLPSTRLYLNHKLHTSIQTLVQPINAPASPQSIANQYLGNGNVLSFQSNSPNNFINTLQLQPSQPVAQFTQRFETSSPAVMVQPFTQNAQCGQDAGVSAFIYGGDEVMRGQFPWLTAIYVKSAGLRFLCGGSLVSTRTVISAGHCFKIGSLSASRLVVNVGRYNLEDYSEQGFLTREIQRLIIHPEYSANVFPDADLAMLHLQQPVQLTNFIRPICLWAEASDPNFIVGSTGVVAGWGADESGRTFTPLPKKVNANIVSDSECLRSSQAYNVLTSPRTFCAGNRDGSGPCMGDSGSGLMINRNGRWYLRGIVSAGQTKQQRCNLQEFVVFCDVAKHIQWVQSNTVS